MADLTIGFWDGPPTPFVTPERFQQIVQCGFTLAMPTSDEPLDKTHVQAYLAAAQAANIPALIGDQRISNPTNFDNLAGRADAVVQDWKQASGVLGYFLADEPDPKQNPQIFTYLGQIVSELRSKDPARSTYLNLLPLGYGPYTDEQDYTHYVERCITEVKPHLLSFDHYPVDSQAGRDGFTTNLRVFRDVCKAHGQPFWGFVDAFPPLPPGKPVPGSSLDHLRWQALEVLRYGASGIMYFTYWTPTPSVFDGTEAMVTRNGTLTQRYNEVKNLNHDLRTLSGGIADALFGRVRATPDVPGGAGDLWLLDSSVPPTAAGERPLSAPLTPAGWDWMTQTAPGYGLVNARNHDVNGFWLSARNDLLDRTFYVLNVVADSGRLYRVTRAAIDDLGPAGWADPHKQNMLGMYFNSNGFWVSYGP